MLKGAFSQNRELAVKDQPAVAPAADVKAAVMPVDGGDCDQPEVGAVRLVDATTPVVVDQVVAAVNERHEQYGAHHFLE